MSFAATGAALSRTCRWRMRESNSDCDPASVIVDKSPSHSSTLVLVLSGSNAATAEMVSLPWRTNNWLRLSRCETLSGVSVLSPAQVGAAIR